jgi:RND family efflux transporter MFP subunit
MTRRIVVGTTLLVVLAVIGVAAFVERARLAQWPYVKVLIGERQESTAPAQPAPATSATRGEVAIDPRRQQLMGVETVAVTRDTIAETVRAVGVVRADETRLADVNVKIEGWIRDLHVDYTGQAVHAGDPLFTLYSPDLLETQNEYLLALRTRDALRSSVVPDAIDRANQLVAAARQRLTLWDISADQIDELDRTHHADGIVVFRSPASGVVLEKQAVMGAHVMPGQTLYRLADLSTVWIEADVNENDIALVHVGDTANVTVDAYPGRRFSARLIYVNALVDEPTRTTKARFQFPNQDSLLKPGMFASVELRLAASAALVVPVNAVLDSGTEQVVFVAKGNGFFEPRQVRIGRRIDAHVQIIAGLAEGDRIATGATFFLDSESQLDAGLRGYTSGAAPDVNASSSQLVITLRTQPTPPKAGSTQFDVTVKDAAGQPIDDADVTIDFYMAAMPTMSMPAMRNRVQLSHVSAEVYRGTGEILSAGRWDVTVVVIRGGHQIGAQRLSVVAR